ncbi:MAG TPA: DUF2095 family protein [Candidatus Limnocylindrales bacterium]|nr:DUF2095 family protein [Candidatus Limnocylindrales bacterium]
MAIDKESLRKMFPNLYRELEEGEVKISIDALRKNPQEAEDETEAAEAAAVEEPKTRTDKPDKLRHFNPTAVDFIRRCDTEAQAEEIVAYLLKKGEITEEYAEELRCQLKRRNLRSFGPKKEENYYFREGGIF